MLSWRTLPYEPHKALVVGTELAMAFMPGTLSRFAVYERRTRVWDERERRHYPSTTYCVRDAGSITDDQRREGVKPKIVFRSDDWKECVQWAQEQK